MKSIRGLTLAEVILSLGLLAIVGLAMMGAFVGGNQMAQKSVDMSAATDVSREFIEQVKAGSFEKTTVGVFDGSVPTPIDPANEFPPAPYPLVRRNNVDFTLVVTCEDYSVTTRLVKVRVFFGKSGQTEMGTLIHR